MQKNWVTMSEESTEFHNMAKWNVYGAVGSSVMSLLKIHCRVSDSEKHYNMHIVEEILNWRRNSCKQHHNHRNHKYLFTKGPSDSPWHGHESHNHPEHLETCVMGFPVLTSQHLWSYGQECNNTYWLRHQRPGFFWATNILNSCHIQ